MLSWKRRKVQHKTRSCWRSWKITSQLCRVHWGRSWKQQQLLLLHFSSLLLLQHLYLLLLSALFSSDNTTGNFQLAFRVYCINWNQIETNKNERKYKQRHWFCSFVPISVIGPMLHARANRNLAGLHKLKHSFNTPPHLSIIGKQWATAIVQQY